MTITEYPALAPSTGVSVWVGVYKCYNSLHIMIRIILIISLSLFRIIRDKVQLHPLSCEIGTVSALLLYLF